MGSNNLIDVNQAALKSSHRGRVFVVSGPSGVGKGTVIKRVIAATSHLGLSVSATTRPPRPGEVEGTTYHFLSKQQFIQGIEEHIFYEYAEYDDHYYGTLRKTVDSQTEQGIDLVLEIDIQGARLVRRMCPTAVLIYMLPPSIAELRCRLTSRVEADIRKKLGVHEGEELKLTPEQRAEMLQKIEKRLAIARVEIACVAEEYVGQYVITNVAIDTCSTVMETIVSAERQRLVRSCDFTSPPEELAS